LKEQGEALGLKTRLSLVSDAISASENKLKYYKWEGVVKGTCYLHQFNPSIIHGDIKPVPYRVNSLANGN
jgi:hypothetical protein